MRSMWEGKGWVLALLIAGVGFWLRLEGLGTYWVNGDEGFYDFIAHAPLDLARDSMVRSADPPLFFWLLRGAATLSDEFLLLRFPSLLGGTLGILAMYWLGRELAGEFAGWVAAALMALSPGAIELSTSIRPYALEALAFTLALLFVVRFMRTRNRRDLVAYVASSSIAMLLQYGALLSAAALVAATVVAAVTGRFRASDRRDLLLAQLPLVALGSALFLLHIRPALMGSAIQTEAVNGWLASQFVANPGDVGRAFVGVFDFLLGTRASLAGALAFLSGVAICGLERRREAVVLCVGAFGLAIALSALSLYPFGGTWHSFHLAPIAFATIAIGAARVAARGRFAVGIAVGFFIAFVAAASPTAALLGLPADRTSGVPQVRIPFSEVATLREKLDEIVATPGALLIDLETAYRLSPLRREADTRPLSIGSPPLTVYRWGERRVIVASVRRFDDGRAPRRSSRHVSRLLRHAMNVPELAELIDRDTVVIATDDGRTFSSIQALTTSTRAGSELATPLAATEHFEIFRLDAERYRSVLVEHREALRKRRGRRKPGME